jgi:hypothetical protein
MTITVNRRGNPRSSLRLSDLVVGGVFHDLKSRAILHKNKVIKKKKKTKKKLVQSYQCHDRTKGWPWPQR